MLYKSILIIAVLTGGIVLTPTYANHDRHHEQAIENNAKIRAILKHGLPTKHISIHADDHILQAIGFVDNKKQMRNLIEILDKYRENDRVINNVKVLKSSGYQEDEKVLAHKIYEALDEMKFPASDISIQVRNGHVIVGGFISKYIRAGSVGDAISLVPGVQTIDNYVLYKS